MQKSDWFESISNWKDEEERQVHYVGDYLYVGSKESAEAFGLPRAGEYVWNTLLNKYELQ